MSSGFREFYTVASKQLFLLMAMCLISFLPNLGFIKVLCQANVFVTVKDALTENEREVLPNLVLCSEPVEKVMKKYEEGKEELKGKVLRINI